MEKEIRFITRKELKELCKNSSRFKEENSGKLILIVDNRYRIFVNGGKTEVERENNPMVSLYESQMPQYIYDFVF